MVCDRGDSDLWNGVAFCVHLKSPKKIKCVGLIVLTKLSWLLQKTFFTWNIGVWGFNNMESARVSLLIGFQWQFQTFWFKGSLLEFAFESVTKSTWWGEAIKCQKARSVKFPVKQTRPSSSLVLRKTSRWRFCWDKSYMDHLHPHWFSKVALSVMTWRGKEIF